MHPLGSSLSSFPHVDAQSPWHCWPLSDRWQSESIFRNSRVLDRGVMRDDDEPLVRGVVRGVEVDEVRYVVGDAHGCCGGLEPCEPRCQDWSGVDEGGEEEGVHFLCR